MIRDCNKKEKYCGVSKVVIPAALGDENGEYKPENGAYSNTLVEYQASGVSYLYSNDGIPTRMGDGVVATIEIGETTTLQPGESATVENAGDKYHAVLNFGIPEGQKGDTGDAATIEVGTTTTSAPGSDASVTNSGDEHNAVLDFVIPRGSQGLQGVPGQAATIEVGTVTTLDPDQDATVANSGTTSAAVFDFGIPKGDKGDTGSISSEVVTELPVPGDDSKLYLMEKNPTVETADGAEFTIQNTATDGEMKLIELKGNATQNGTPTPDAPVAVNTTTGENAVKIYPDQKNLADPQTFIAWANRTYDLCVQYGWGNDSIRPAVIEYNGRPNVLRFTASTLYDVRGQMTSPTYDEARVIMTGNFKPATQYTISFDVPAGNKRNLQLFFSDGSAVLLACQNTTDDWAHFSQTSTAGRTLVGLRLTYNTGTTYIDLDTLQIEEGTQASSYEPYQGQEYTINLGSIELVKIDNYQDRIYKTDGKWYVEKQVGKVVLDGSSDEGWSAIQGGNCFNKVQSDIKRGSNDTQISDVIISDYYSPTAYNLNYSGQGGSGITSPMPTPRISIRNASINTLAGFTTWLASHPTTVYYALATPTTTEITDSTLLAQLNFIANLYGGTNNIILVGTGAQGEIAVEYQTWDKYNRYDVYIWNDQIGDYQILNS